MTLSELQASAVAAIKTRYAADVARRRLPDWQNVDLPSRLATAGAVSCEAIMPSNRTVYRKPHFRFIYRLNGAIVNEAAAQAELQKEG